jgi:hypothetical protein
LYLLISDIVVGQELIDIIQMMAYPAHAHDMSVASLAEPYQWWEFMSTENPLVSHKQSANGMSVAIDMPQNFSYSMARLLGVEKPLLL